MSGGRLSLLRMTPNITSHSMNAHTKMQARANLGSRAERRMWKVWTRSKKGVMLLGFAGSGPRNHCATLCVRAATGAGILLLIFFQWGPSCHGRGSGEAPGKPESVEFISMSARGSFDDCNPYGGTPAGSMSRTMAGGGGVALSTDDRVPLRLSVGREGAVRA